MTSNAEAVHRPLAVTASADAATRGRLLQLHGQAAAFYQARLKQADEHRAVVAYLAERQVSRAEALAHGWGHAPSAWTALTAALRAAGASHEELLLAGLALRSSRGQLIDRFRDRLVLPIRDRHGRTIAFTGRALRRTSAAADATRPPKYLNSPTTPLYRKGQVLYGLDAQACSALAAGALPVLVEGVFDVRAVNLAARAVAEAHPPRFVGVAACGTALTPEQVDLLDAATGGLEQRGIVVAFDGDDAGRAAAARVFWLLQAVNAWPLQAELASNADPATLIEQAGPAELLNALERASDRPLADQVVDERIERYAEQLHWAEGTVAAGRSAAAVVADLPVEHMSRQIVRLVARLRLPPAEVSDLVVDAMFARGRQSSAPASAGSVRAASTRTRQRGPDASGLTSRTVDAAQHRRIAFPAPILAAPPPHAVSAAMCAPARRASAGSSLRPTIT